MSQLFLQIMIGTTIIVTTIILSAILIGLAIPALEWFSKHFLRLRHVTRTIIALVATTTWFVFVITVNVWLWAFAFLGLGVFAELEESLYFSLVAFTTLGFGDIILSQDWRLLSGFVATAGFILFGLGTAFLFEVIRISYREGQQKN